MPSTKRGVSSAWPKYQMRVWKGWHHHISLACLALLFSTKMKLQTRSKVPLLSTRDITELLDFYLRQMGPRPLPNALNLLSSPLFTRP